MSRATLILLSLAAGLLVGVAVATLSPVAAGYGLAVAGPVGTLWLNGLQMTVIPLVVTLLITGVAATAEAAQAGRIAGRAIATFLTLVTLTATMAALVTPVLLRMVPIPRGAAAALKTALGHAAPVGETPPISEFLSSIVPTNVFAAATNNALLSLILFTLAFAFAMTRIEPGGRAQLLGFFTAIRDAMLVLIGWVLWLAPLGVFALAFVVGASAGGAAFGALAHYIATIASVGVLVMLMAYGVAAIAGRVPLSRFARALAPAQAVAISTQSSLASLPAMVEGTKTLRIQPTTSSLVLPMAVAMFRGTQPAMNVAVALYIADWFGIVPCPAAVVAAVVAAILVSLGSASLPSQITFFASIAPVCVALGVPAAPLGLLIAVETIPDIFRTLGNVSMDLAATATVSRWSGTIDEERP
ncbi:dicarboxylate/amino acid:cation symporter [Sphingomonas sp. Leaf21]|jgi:Na+/H+-dicarboxylate symporter|uniref:dicarboxylate/amino acid:cation symporter n=1 Tax=Sphingomonas sp. Leaf21 TaxID=2876550 RepID=UPI001E2A22C3|nr:cation:dicarboxylase symporter family transporter [Sphingomonas sp. Leaf21]